MIIAAIASVGAVLCTMYDPGEDKGTFVPFNLSHIFNCNQACKNKTQNKREPNIFSSSLKQLTEHDSVVGLGK